MLRIIHLLYFFTKNPCLFARHSLQFKCNHFSRNRVMANPQVRVPTEILPLVHLLRSLYNCEPTKGVVVGLADFVKNKNAEQIDMIKKI